MVTTDLSRRSFQHLLGIYTNIGIRNGFLGILASRLEERDERPLLALQICWVLRCSLIAKKSEDKLKLLKRFHIQNRRKVRCPLYALHARLAMRDGWSWKMGCMCREGIQANLFACRFALQVDALKHARKCWLMLLWNWYWSNKQRKKKHTWKMRYYSMGCNALLDNT